METWLLQDDDHAIPIDSDGNPEDGGVEVAYIVNAGLCGEMRSGVLAAAIEHVQWSRS